MRRLAMISFGCLLWIPALTQHLISGSVRNEEGVALPGASVYEMDQYSGTVTNAEGEFELEVAPGPTVIVVDFLGYKELIDSVDASQNVRRDYVLKVSPMLSQEVIVEATRARSKTPVTYQNLSREEVDENNLGQDLPILLNQTVSAVTTSDAGAGVGYTGLRIRGSDATRINVTVNGVPLNDAESHGVFWVNMPDFASTTDNLQIQRGVGTSSNGAAAFGASVNLETTGFDSAAYVAFNNSYGSFNTRKHNVVFNSGLVSKHLNFEGRLSYIGSDGYIDRSAADLRSYYVAGGYYRKKLLVKGVVFSGREVTQQAWWGTPESRIDGDDQAMLDHAANNGYTETQTENLLNSGRTYNYYTYDNEVDNYGQDHYQLITGFQVSPHLYLNLTGHYTRGKGYFEQFKGDDDLLNYGLSYPVFGTDTITSGDVIVRRWLDNHFYGVVHSLQFNRRGTEITIGGSANEYIGDHYGEIIWSEYTGGSEIRDQYYFSDSRKRDVSNYVRLSQRLGHWWLYADVQYRFIDYNSEGVDNDQRPILIDEDYHFLNPKLGVTFDVDVANSLYVSVAQASREPVRSDFTDAVPGVTPKPEYLTNGEMGWRHRSTDLQLSLNGYFMYYIDQLVLTGEVNDVGSPIRTNVPQSYRAGIEGWMHIDLVAGLYLESNATISQNKIIEFEEVVYDYTNGFDITTVDHENSDIAFSPPVIAGNQLGYKTDFGLTVEWMAKFVSRQFLDNTSNLDRAIDSYFVNDLRFSYDWKSKFWKELQFNLLVNNVLDHQYESNGYTYSYIFGGLITENFYYPQAGRNYLAGVTLKF